MPRSTRESGWDNDNHSRSAGSGAHAGSGRRPGTRRRRGLARAEGDRRSLPGADRPAQVLPAQGRDDLVGRADLRAAAVDHQHRHRPDPGLVEVDALRPARSPHNPRGEPTLSLPFFGGTGFAIGDHPFGQDETGRDLFAAIMRGIQNTMVVIIVLAVLSTTLGVVVGAVSGYFGGWWDAVLMRLTDIIIIIPVILITAVAGYALGASGVLTVAVVMGLFLWVGLARLVRGGIPGAARTRIRRCGPGRRGVVGADHLQAHPAELGRRHRGQHDAAARRRHPHRGRAELPRFRHPAAGHLARLADQPVLRSARPPGRGCSSGRASSSSSSCCASSSSVTGCATRSTRGRSGCRSRRT